jgi:hypothetical protein
MGAVASRPLVRGPRRPGGPGSVRRAAAYGAPGSGSRAVGSAAASGERLLGRAAVPALHAVRRVVRGGPASFGDIRADRTSGDPGSVADLLRGVEAVRLQVIRMTGGVGTHEGRDLLGVVLVVPAALADRCGPLRVGCPRLGDRVRGFNRWGRRPVTPGASRGSAPTPIVLQRCGLIIQRGRGAAPDWVPGAAGGIYDCSSSIPPSSISWRFAANRITA